MGKIRHLQPRNLTKSVDKKRRKELMEYTPHVIHIKNQIDNSTNVLKTIRKYLGGVYS